MEETTDIAPPQEPQPPKKKLWQALNSSGDYTKSFDEFSKQFSTPESVGKLHDALAQHGDYTKGADEFFNQYFSDLKKKSSANGVAPSSATQSQSQLGEIPHLQQLMTFHQNQQTDALRRQPTQLKTIDPEIVKQRNIEDTNKINDAFSKSGGDLERAAFNYAGVDEAGMAEAKAGSYVKNFLNNPNVIQRAQQDPDFKKAYNTAKFNFQNHYPSAAYKDLNQKIGQYMEDNGMVNAIYNNPSAEKVDKAVDEMKKKGILDDRETHLYQTQTRPQLSTLKSYISGSPIPTADVVNQFSKSLERQGGNIVQATRDVLHNASLGAISYPDQQKATEQQEYSTPTVETKDEGKKEALNVADILGFATPAILGGLAGVPAMGTMSLQLEGQNRHDAMIKYPDDKTKQDIYTILTTGVDLAAGSKLPFGEASKAIGELVDDAVAGKITQQEAKNKYLDFLKEFGKHTASGVAGLETMQVGHNAADAALGGKNFNLLEQGKEALGRLPSDLIAMAFMGGIAASKHLQSAESQPEKSVLQSAIYNGEIKGMFGEVAKEAMKTPEGESQFFREVADQANNKGGLFTDEEAQKRAEETFGQRLVSHSQGLYPKEAQAQVSEQVQEVPAAQEQAPQEKAPNEPTLTAGKVEPIRITGTNIFEHAQDEYTADGKENGLSDSGLTEKGKNQATNLGEVIGADPRITKIHTGVTKRTIETSEIAANKANETRGFPGIKHGTPLEEANGVKVLPSDLLTTLDVGDATGKKTGAFDEKYYFDHPDEVPSGSKTGETINQFKQRMEKAYDFAYHQTDQTDAMVVSSKVIRAFKALSMTDGKWTDETTKEFLDEERADTPKSKEPPKETEEENKPKVRVSAKQLENLQPENELPFGKSKTTGIAHDIQQARTVDTNSMPPERGEGVSVEDAVKHGEDLLAQGGDAEKAAEDFKKDPAKNISFDALSLVRAKHRQLVKASDAAEEQFGEKSKQYRDAVDAENKWYNETVKPMQTEWSKIGQAQQGDVDIDTGSYQGLKRARTQSTGQPLTSKEVREARDLSGKVQKLSKQVETLKQKLSDALDKAEKAESSKNIKQKAKDIADLIRKGKTSRPDQFSAASPASLVWDGALEVMAKTVELSGTAAQAIADGLEYIRNSDWYKGLSNDKQRESEQSFRDYFNADITTKFVDKKDNKFFPDEAKEIWDYAKENYIDQGKDFDQMISGVSMDLGLTRTQVRDALTTPKGTKVITDEMYRAQYERSKAIQQAKDWAKSSNKSGIGKFLSAIPRFFFAAKVAGHGTVGMVTHAGGNIFDPVEWKRYWPVFLKQFKFAYGNKGDYEKAMQDIKNDPQFIFWKRNGLAVDPSERYDEYQFITKIFNKMGKVGHWLTAGDRGFNALKVYRLMRAKSMWDKLSNAEKADPNTAKEIAKLVNHSTGTVGGKVSEAANVAFFAPKLELSRWNRIIVDPAKSVKTFTNWGKATPAEKAAAKFVAKKTGRVLATYVSALAANQALLSLSGSNQKINLLDPSQKDWLKFKVGGRTIDPTGGLVSLFGFLTRLGEVATSKKVKGGRGDALYKQTGDYVSGKLSPFASTAKDVTTHHDFQGNTLPMYEDKPLHSWNKKLGWEEYVEQQQLPIPVSEYFTDVQKEMKDEGIKQPQLGDVMKSLVVAATVGGTGLHIGEESKDKKVEGAFKIYQKNGNKVRESTEEEIKTVQQNADNIQSQLMNDARNNRGWGLNKYGEITVDRDKIRKKGEWNDLSQEDQSELQSRFSEAAKRQAKEKIKF